LDTGELLREFGGHTGRINALTVDPDGKHAISGSDDLTVRIWRLDSGKCRVFAGHKYGISGLSISPDGSKLVSFSSGDRDLRVWNLESGALLSKGTVSLEFLGGHVQTRSGMPGIVGPWEDMVVTYDVKERVPLHRRYKFGEVIAIAVSKDGERVLTSAREHRHCIFWDPRSGEVLGHVPMHQVVTVVALSPDRHVAATACADGIVKLWDIVSGMEVASFHCDAAVVCCAIGGQGEDWRLVTCDAFGRLQFLRTVKAGT
jgi:WD40 repeat protein